MHGNAADGDAPRVLFIVDGCRWDHNRSGEQSSLAANLYPRRTCIPRIRSAASPAISRPQGLRLRDAGLWTIVRPAASGETSTVQWIASPIEHASRKAKVEHRHCDGIDGTAEWHQTSS